MNIPRKSMRLERPCGQGTCISFIGYSMPEADFEFRQVLKSAELANRGGARKTIRAILKKDKQAASRYRRFFGLNSDSVDQGGLSEWVQRDFESWLTAINGMAP